MVGRINDVVANHSWMQTHISTQSITYGKSQKIFDAFDRLC
jgi:hypothetical protein